MSLEKKELETSDIITKCHNLKKKKVLISFVFKNTEFQETKNDELLTVTTFHIFHHRYI